MHNLNSKQQEFFKEQPALDAARLLRQVEEIQESFRSLERHRYSPERLVSLKFSMMHWRESALGAAMRILDSKPSAISAESAFDALSRLELKPDACTIERLVKLALEILTRTGGEPAKSLLKSAAAYFAKLGEHEALQAIMPAPDGQLMALAGPQTRLKIIANAPSRHSTAVWSAMDDLTRHEFKGEGVVYRGTQLLPGDIFICNVNRDGNGMFTFLAEPRSYAYHLGVFAIIDIDGKKFPVVMEAYKLGVRPVPLCVFLSPRFNSYAELYRLKEKSDGFHDKINLAAAQAEKAVKGYNFDTEDPDRSYLACTTLAHYFFEHAGVKPVSTKSRYSRDPGIQKNLKITNINYDAFLGLTDFVIDARLKYLGAFDNAHLDRNIARELCERHFFDLLSKHELRFSKMPFFVTLGRVGIPLIRRGGWLGRLAGKSTGFTPENLPRGPTKIMAAIEVYEHMIALAARRLAPQIRNNLASQQAAAPFDIDRLCSDPSINEILQQLLKPLRATCV